MATLILFLGLLFLTLALMTLFSSKQKVGRLAASANSKPAPAAAESEANRICDLFLTDPALDGAQMLIAYKTAKLLYEAGKGSNRQHGSKELPETPGELALFFTKIILSQADQFENEASTKRLQWLTLGARLLQITEYAEGTKSFESEVAQVWAKILKRSGNLLSVIDHCILWSDDEKSSFKRGPGHPDSDIQHLLNIIVPNWLKMTPEIRSFAKSVGFPHLAGEIFMNLDCFAPKSNGQSISNPKVAGILR